MLPMSYIFKAGHRLRLTLFFADPACADGAEQDREHHSASRAGHAIVGDAADHSGWIGDEAFGPWRERRAGGGA